MAMSPSNKTPLVRIKDDSLWLAIEQTSERFGVTPEQFVLDAVKYRLEGINVVWWKSGIEINTPGDSG